MLLLHKCVLYLSKQVDVMEPIYVKLYKYKSFRHYGGREIETSAFRCKAMFIKRQSDHTNVVELLEDCIDFKKGHLIAIMDKDFNV